MSQSDPSATWVPVGRADLQSLTLTRLELHWAVRIVGSVPAAYRAPRPDHCHANLAWIASSGALVSRGVGEHDVRVGLEFEAFRLTLLDSADEVVASLALEGRTLGEGFDWTAARLRELGVGTGSAAVLVRLAEGPPFHPVRAGVPFSRGDGRARTELRAWYGNAHSVLADLAATRNDASEVRCWPHHFDMATLVTIQASEGPKQMRSVGVGMTPGDESYAEPYFYVTPWPYPSLPDLPPLDGAGAWHDDGWIGAVLTRTRLVEAGDASAQRERAVAFLRSAFHAAVALATP
jgi:hypothetical protein